MSMTNPIYQTEYSELQQLKTYYNRLFSTFSHEVRNPLTMINSTLQLLESDCPVVQKSDLWQQLKQDVTDMIHLLQNMSALNNSDTVLQTTISAYELLQNVSGSFASFAEEKNIRFAAHFDHSISSLCLYGDKVKLRQAFTNLLVNAADAVQECPYPGIILMSANLDAHYLSVRITDNGPGIPYYYLDSIFEPFVTHKSHGTGLGLGIVKNVIEQHGGSVNVHTNTTSPDTYTEFTVKLPA